MRVIIQRVLNASCEVNEILTGEINKGLMILVGFTHDDSLINVQKMVKKIINLRIFNDDEGKMNRNLLDVNGAILSISQFTLYANSSKGNRPSFEMSMKKEEALNLYNCFNDELIKYNIKVEKGIFGADMKIKLTNDGPVTIFLEN